MFTNPTETQHNVEQKVNTDNKLIMTEISFLWRASCSGKKKNRPTLDFKTAAKTTLNPFFTESRDRFDQYHRSLAIASSLPDYTSSETTCKYRVTINTSTFWVEKNTSPSQLRTQKNHPQMS